MILLTFDDCRILDWASLLPIMLRSGVRATFYVSNQATIDSDGWPGYPTFVQPATRFNITGSTTSTPSRSGTGTNT